MEQSLGDTRFVVQRTDNGASVALPMRTPYVPIPEWFTGLDLFAVIVVPIWIIGAGIVRWALRIQPPPRALFEIDAERFRMHLVARDTGERTTFECNRDAIVELRKNRYEKRLWIHVRGVTMHTYLQDVDDDTIVSLSDSLRSILRQQDCDMPRPVT